MTGQDGQGPAANAKPVPTGNATGPAGLGSGPAIQQNQQERQREPRESRAEGKRGAR